MSESRRGRWEREHPVKVLWLAEPVRLLPGGRGPRVVGVMADADPAVLQRWAPSATTV
jgi:hypothetical protein